MGEQAVKSTVTIKSERMPIPAFFDGNKIVDHAGKAIGATTFGTWLADTLAAINIHELVLFLGGLTTAIYGVMKIVGWFQDRPYRKERQRLELEQMRQALKKSQGDRDGSAEA